MGSSKLSLWRTGAGLAVVLATTFTSSLLLSGQASSAFPPVVKAECGPGSNPESGLQGQLTSAERFSGPRVYNCNMELVGQFRGEGVAWDMGLFDVCAYVGTSDGPGRQNRGTMVLDVSDSRSPKAVAWLDSPAFVQPNEALSVHAGRRLLASTLFHQNNFDVYDISNCRQPVLKSSIKLPNLEGHASSFSPDGRTYYGTSWQLEQGNPFLGPPDSMFAIDLSDPSRPREIARWAPDQTTMGKTHHVHISPDGNRAYVSLLGSAANGFVILDISDIQARRSNPQFRVIQRRVGIDAGGTQSAMPITINRVSYLITTGGGGAPAGGPAAACAQGLPISGPPLFHDISDERNPRLVGTATLEVHSPANCAKVLNDSPAGSGSGSLFCAVDNPLNAKLMACGFSEGGLRAFDIRDPKRVRELGYYKPPSRGKEPIRPGSWFAYRPPATERTADPVVFVGGIRPGGEIWFMSHDNGFQIVRFTEWLKAKEKPLF